MSDLHHALQSFYDEAAAALAEPASIPSMLDTAQLRAAGDPKLREGLDPLRGLVADYVSGEFDRADAEDVAWALAAVLYVISPWDLAPDYLPGGLRDDDRVVRSVTEQITPVLREHADWVHMTRRSYRATRRPV